VHDPSHPLRKLRIALPAATAAGRASFSLAAPEAEYRHDVTLPDHAAVLAGSSARKLWAVANTGAEAWPAGCSLVYIGGPLAPAPTGTGTTTAAATSFELPCVAAGAVAEIGCEIAVPAQARGRVFGNFRLTMPSGKRFGECAPDCPLALCSSVP
jgi:hypothetical protein